MFDEQFEGAAIGTDGSVVMSGYTYGSWSATKEEDDDDMDFVAMSMDANGNILWTYQVGSKVISNGNTLDARLLRRMPTSPPTTAGGEGNYQ